MTIRITHPAISTIVTLGDRLARPLRLQLVLDGMFLVVALATFDHLWNPDALFHVLWVILTLHAFLFGLRVSVVRIFLTVVLLILYSEMGTSIGRGEALFVSLDPAEWILMVVIALMVAVMADGVAATSRRYAELYRRASDRLLTAQEDERIRLGRDLHDGVGQTLTAIVLNLDAVESTLRGSHDAAADLAREEIRRTQELAAIALDETREVANHLRPGRFVEIGLVAAVRRLAETAGFPVTVVADPVLAHPGLLDPDDEMGVYRVIQEALGNAVRYAKAQLIKVELLSDGSTMTVRVSDDGIGFDAKTKQDRGLGLAGMRERALILRAEFTVESTPGSGSSITLSVPLPKLDWPVDPESGTHRVGQPEGSR